MEPLWPLIARGYLGHLCHCALMGGHTLSNTSSMMMHTTVSLLVLCNAQQDEAVEKLLLLVCLG